MNGRSAGLALVILLVLVALPGRAWANAAARFVAAPANEGGAFIVRPTSLVVDCEKLGFRCDARDCQFTAVYHVMNPGDAREEVLGAFYGIEAEKLTATANGVDARRTLTPEQLRAVDDVVAVSDPAVVRDSRVTREGFVLGVDAHARATLVFSGRMHPFTFETRSDVVGEYGLPPLETRHLVLGTRARKDTISTYAYALSPLQSWAGSPTIDVTVRCPSARYWGRGQDGWTVGRDADGFVARRTLGARDASTLHFDVVTPGTSVLHGGPLVGFGGRIDAGELRGRFGYEAAVPWWVIWSTSVETSFKGTTTIIPLGEVATPDLLAFIPSLGLGAGVPVQMRSGAPTQVGARLQLTFSWPVLSVVLPVDLFPRAQSGDVFQVGLYAQASF